MTRWIICLVAASLLLISSSALAGPYLNTSAMLLQENQLAAAWVRNHLGDKQLAQNAHKMAQARVDVAARMNVPDEVKQAHPHLLLALSAMERAMQAAVDGQVSNFIAQLQTSSGEAKTFQAVLKTLGYSLPTSPKRAMLMPRGNKRLDGVRFLVAARQAIGARRVRFATSFSEGPEGFASVPCDPLLV